MSKKDHCGLTKEAFRTGAVKNGKWTLADWAQKSFPRITSFISSLRLISRIPPKNPVINLGIGLNFSNKIRNNFFLDMGEQDVVYGHDLLQYTRASNDKEASFLLLLFLSRAPVTRDPENGEQWPWVLWPMAFYFTRAMGKASMAFYFLVLESGWGARKQTCGGTSRGLWRRSIYSNDRIYLNKEFWPWIKIN